MSPATNGIALPKPESMPDTQPEIVLAERLSSVADSSACVKKYSRDFAVKRTCFKVPTK